MTLLDLPETSPTICTFHGNGGTPIAFSLIKMALKHPQHKYVDFSYSSKDGYDVNLKAMSEKLLQIPGKVFLLGHSMGGLFAAQLAVMHPGKVVAVLTMSTPFGGSEPAAWLGIVFPCQLFEDIRPSSQVIRKLRRATIPCPLHAIVTTAGQSSIWQKLNDGVVSRESMYDREGAEFIEVEYNHSEVLMSVETVEIIRNAIDNVMEVNV